MHRGDTGGTGRRTQLRLTLPQTAPRVRPSWQLTSRGLAAFHATSSTSTARSGWLPRPTTTRTSPCSAAWDRGAGGSQVLGCPSLMTTERNHMPHALVRARNHSDSMRWRRHVESANWRDLSTTWIARPDRAKPSRHTVSPTWDGSVRCGSKPWSVERLRRAPVPHATTLCRESKTIRYGFSGIEM